MSKVKRENGDCCTYLTHDNHDDKTYRFKKRKNSCSHYLSGNDDEFSIIYLSSIYNFLCDAEAINYQRIELLNYDIVSWW